LAHKEVRFRAYKPRQIPFINRIVKYKNHILREENLLDSMNKASVSITDAFSIHGNAVSYEVCKNSTWQKQK
jgi:hypothetical protein